MTKSHVTGWALDAPTPAQFKELFAQIESGRVTKDTLQSFLRGEIAEFFPISIDYAMSLADMIATCKLDWVNNDITQEHFQITGNGTVELTSGLIHYARPMSTDNILMDLDRRGYRPATLPELLAFGAKFPEKQREFPIVALASVCRLSYGNRYVACLDGGASGRYLRLYYLEHAWSSHCRFLAVRK